MKTHFRFQLLAALFLTGTAAVAGFQSDPSEEVPGDNFSLEGALELFKKSASPQEFEQMLNSSNSKVNNLDLNGDGETDYIRVVDRAEGNIHTFTMQAIVSKTEAQDIAVIELEKRDDGTAVLQIVGDADIYGIETIIEPTTEVRVNAGTTSARTVVNVWAWPSVQYVYSPAYVAWVSPWYWSYYPMWWSPWRPIAWHIYDPYWAPYRPYYSMCWSHRVYYAPRLYRPYRTTSVIVYNRHYTQISHYRTSRDVSYGRRSDRSSSYGRSDGSSRSRSGDRNAYSSSREGNNSSRSRGFDSQRASRYAPAANDMRERTSRSDFNSRPSREFSTGNGRESNESPSRNFESNTSRSRMNESNNRMSEPNSGSTPSRRFEPRQESSPRREFTRPESSSPSRSTPSRSFSSPNDGGSRQQRSFSAPGNGGGGSRQQRSFSAPSGGGGHQQRSFSAPGGGGGGRSNGAPSGGGGNGGGGRSRSRN